MKDVKVYLSNKTSYITGINGTNKEIKNYFKVGKTINIGTVGDKLVKIKKIYIFKNKK